MPRSTNGHSGQQAEIIKKSATYNDHVVNIRKNGNSSVYYLSFPFSSPFAQFGASSGLPAYWSPARDNVLRATTLMEGFWSSVVSMWVSKVASQSWELKGLRIARYQELLLTNWIDFISKLGKDFLTTDNGCFAQIVRESNAAGSRIIGLVELDACRVTRTGDPQYPLIFRDLLGQLHALRDYEVIMLSDSPTSDNKYWGVGGCAAARVWDSLTTMVPIDQLVQEKVTGNEPTAISIVNASLDEDQLRGAIDVAKEQRASQGYVRYMGVVVIPMINLDAQPSVATIPLKGLPDGFDSEKEIEKAQLKYAIATGLDPQIVNPRLIGSGSRGTSAQSDILREEQQGHLPTLFKHTLTHQLNQMVLPGTVTFYFNRKDQEEERKQAQINLLHAQTIKALVDSGVLTPSQGQLQLAQLGVLSPAFLPTDTKLMPLADTDKPDEVQLEIDQPTETDNPTGEPKQLGIGEPKPTQPATKEFDPIVYARALGTDPLSRQAKAQWEHDLKMIQDKMKNGLDTVQPTAT